jgi:hypothetical protein
MKDKNTSKKAIESIDKQGDSPENATQNINLCQKVLRFIK